MKRHFWIFSYIWILGLALIFVMLDSVIKYAGLLGIARKLGVGAR